jgi:hypothetical protein
MKTLNDIKQFYETQLLSDLSFLEKRRKNILYKLNFLGIVILLIMACSIPVLLFKSNIELPVIIVLIIIPAGIGFSASVWITRGYRKEFKSHVIEKIIKFINPGLGYNYKNFIPQSTFELSQIFKTKPNIYKGDDYVCGRIGDTKIEFSELNALHESGSGKNKTVVTVFKGLFFMADFNKNFTSQTLVLPDVAEKTFGFIGQKLQAMNFSRGQLVKLDNPEFEKKFVVYSNNQIDARYILSLSLMERIVDFKKKTGKDISLSFIGSMIFVTIPYSQNLFEPRIFRTLLDFEVVREYFSNLQLAIGIVEDLNLNTRIWSKV